MRNSIPHARKTIVNRVAWDLLQDTMKTLKQAKESQVIPALAEIEARYERFKHTHRPAARKYAADFESQVRGIPCGVHVSHYSPDLPAIITADPASSHPPEGGEFEAILLRPSGSPNNWLMDQATTQDWERIESEYRAHLEDLRNVY